MYFRCAKILFVRKVFVFLWKIFSGGYHDPFILMSYNNGFYW